MGTLIIPNLVPDENVVLSVLSLLKSRETAMKPQLQMTGFVDLARATTIRGQQLNWAWSLVFLDVGCGAWRLLTGGRNPQPDQPVFTGKFNEQEFAQLLVKKHRAYGPKPICQWGHIGVIIRIDSKIERYKNLTTNEHLRVESDESIFDTLQDIIGYAVLGYRYSTEVNQNESRNTDHRLGEGISSEASCPERAQDAGSAGAGRA